MQGTDLLGNRLSAQEERLLAAYHDLKQLATQSDLPPCAARGVRKALACMWQVINDLDLDFEQLSDVGV
ncbi:MAG: hypothetical protein WCA59_14100 [Candidatus Binataceae bacterium]|jgi:hypothetical protein